MSTKRNRRELRFNYGWENGQWVPHSRDAPDEEGQSQERATALDVRRAALLVVAGVDLRPCRYIGAELGVTGAAINKAVQKIARAVGVPTQREGFKANCSEAQRGRKRKPGEAIEDQLDLPFNPNGA